MKKASDETVQLAAKDELTGKENTMRKFARDLETEAMKLDNYVGAESSPYIGVKPQISSETAILDKIVPHLLLQVLHFFATFQKV
jgi:hypothetical protein